MNYTAPLRNYQQILRIVGDNANSSTDCKLGNAYGEHPGGFANSDVGPTERRIRTLDEINQYSISLRRPGFIFAAGELPTRSGSTLYHDLNSTAQQYLDGHGCAAHGRGAGEPGTKLRVQRDKGAFGERVQDLTPLQFQPNEFTSLG